MQHMVPSISMSGRGGRSVQRLSENSILDVLSFHKTVGFTLTTVNDSNLTTN